MNLLKQAMLFASFVIVSLVSCGASAAESASNTERYALPQRGYLELNVPATWRATVSQPKKPVPPTINFAAREGGPFILNVTPRWRTAANKLRLTKEAVRRRVSHSWGGIRPFARESSLDLIELRGNSGPGFYFTATDSAPRPGGYKYLTKGEVVVEDLVLMFTMLTNEGQQSVVSDALAVLQSARHVSSAGAAAAGTKAGAPQKR